MRRLFLALCVSALPLAPLMAATETPLVPATGTLAPLTQSQLPVQLKPTEAVQYRAVFAAIRASQWADAAARLDAMPDGLLTPFARAEYYLAKGSPKVDASQVAALIERAPELPQAASLVRLARARGIESVAELPMLQDLVRLPGASRRQSARTTRSDAVAMAMGPDIVALIKTNKPAEAEAILTARQADLTPEALTEWQQRIAWSYYLTGDDGNARRLATSARGGFGEWAVQADWVAGLAAWRQQDWAAAGQAFDAVTAHARDYEYRAAGLYWSSRADMAAGQPERIQAKLRTAARFPETFYGLLAGSALGMEQPLTAVANGPASAAWQSLSRYPNIRVAAALNEIGEEGYADTVLRHQARIGIGTSTGHSALLQLAARLDLPATQIWLAQHGPVGAEMPVSARYPVPGWTPTSGWRVDPALVYAHALQESQFRTDAVSRAGAIGLMQIMPNTAQLIAKRKGEAIDRSQLVRPAIAFEYGQSYLEMLRDMAGTQGLLPKIIAAYNAGPGSVAAWNTTLKDGGDPLLFVESIPFAETRGYVATVLRNYWIYARERGKAAGSLKAMAQGLWPRFPGLPGKTAIRLDSDGTGSAGGGISNAH